VTGDTAVFGHPGKSDHHAWRVVLTQCKNVLRGDRLLVEHDHRRIAGRIGERKVQACSFSRTGCGAGVVGSGSPLPALGAPNKPK